MRISTQANLTLLTKLVAAAISYGFTILLARTMTPIGFGQIAVFLNLSLVLAVVGARGQQTAALRFLPPMIAKGDKTGVAGFVSHSIRYASVGTIIVFIIALSCALISKQFGGMAGYSTSLLFLGLILVPLVAWSDLQSYIARGMGFFQLSLIPKEIFWRALTTFGVILAYLEMGKDRLDAPFVVLVLILVLVLVSIVQALIVMRKFGLSKKSPRGDPTPAKPIVWRDASGPFWITSVSNIFLTNMDVVLVGFFAGTKAAGIYFAANRLATMLAFFRASYNVVLSPNLAAAWQNEAIGKTEEIIHSATLKMTLPTVVLGGVMAMFATQFLGLFGAGFTQAALPLQILLVAGILNCCFGPADIALNMCGYHREAMRISAITLVCSAGLLTLGAVTGGETGIALAVLVATVLRKFLFWKKVQQLLSIRCDIVAAVKAALPPKVASQT